MQTAPWCVTSSASRICHFDRPSISHITAVPSTCLAMQGAWLGQHQLPPPALEADGLTEAPPAPVTLWRKAVLPHGPALLMHSQIWMILPCPLPSAGDEPLSPQQSARREQTLHAAVERARVIWTLEALPSHREVPNPVLFCSFHHGVKMPNRNHQTHKNSQEHCTPLHKHLSVVQQAPALT